MQNNPSAVPYQAYKSKRHSRPSSLPTDRPLSADWNTEKLTSEPLVLDIVRPAHDPPEPPSPSDHPPAVNGKHKQSDSLSPASSDTPLPPIVSATPKKASTFRRLQPRPSAARTPLPSSPLRPPEAHSRAPSSSSTITRQLDFTPPRSPPLHSRVPSINSVVSDSHSSSNSSPAVPPLPTSQPPPRSTSLSVPTQLPPPSGPSPITSPSPPFRSSAPYRPGFQPKGVIRLRTDEFSLLRKTKQDASRIERTKLERRLEKLIQLHFPVQQDEPADPKKIAMARRRSSIFNLDLENLRNMEASDIWKGVIQSQAFQGAKADTRAAEQRIAPWQQDAAASKCPLCTASFHPLTNRKHHCRLCGQIICSLPVKHPQRAEPCSILFIVDAKTRQIEEVGEGVDYGVRRRANGTPNGKVNGKQKEEAETLAEEEKFLKGVRVCRSCKPILSRVQFYQVVSRISPLAKLYDAFTITEKEIEEALPLFQELLLTLSLDSPPSKEAAAARKRILDDFASYDAISKRIRQIPCAPGSSEDRVQLAIRTRADLFLQKNMFPLQSLPKVKKQTSSPDATAPLVDPDSELAHALQPLLEQEALLESFVGEAMAHRKFDDAKTLKASLKEIRGEIDRVLENGVGNGIA